MKDKRYTDEMIKGFLLKELPAAESEAIEEKFFSDAECFERICAIENLLVDRYIGERLSHKERELFEHNYLTTPARRQKVAFAKSLARATSQVQTADFRAPEKSGVKAISWWQAIFASLGTSSFIPQLAMAMAFLLLVGGLWAVLKIRTLNRDLIAANQQRNNLEERQQELNRQIHDLERKLAQGSSQSDELAKEIERLREQQKELERQQRERQLNEPQAPSIASFFLAPGSVRGNSEGAKTLAIAPKTETVRFQIQFDTNDYLSYQLQIRTVGGRQVFSQRGLQARAGKDSATVSVKIPAKRLAKDDYILTLSGVDSSQEPVEVEKYFFRVENR